MKFEQLKEQEQESIEKSLEMRLSLLQPSIDILPLEQQIEAFKTAYKKEYKEHHATVILDTKEINTLLDLIKAKDKALDEKDRIINNLKGK